MRRRRLRSRSISSWALSCSSTAKSRVTGEARSVANPKAPFAPCARALPEPTRAFTGKLLQQNKPALQVSPAEGRAGSAPP
jgi:hypothetical protein